MRHAGRKLTRAGHGAAPRRTADRPRHLTVVTAALAVVAISGVATIVGLPTSARTPMPVALNVIANPGFELGLSGWSGSAASVAAGWRAHGGGRYASLASGVGRTSARLTRTPVALPAVELTTEPTGFTTQGSRYHAMVWLAAADEPVFAQLRLRELRGGEIVSQRVAQVMLSGTAWQHLALEYTAVGSHDTLSYSVLGAAVGSGARLLADDAWLSLATGSATTTGSHDSRSPGAEPSGSAAPSAGATLSPPLAPTVSRTSRAATPSHSPARSRTTGSTPSRRPFSYRGRALIGSSLGGSAGATEASFPNMRVARFYYPGAPSLWGGRIAAIPRSQVIFVSFKYPVATTATGGADTAFTQVLRSCAATGRQIYWTWQHEADDPAKGISQSAFQAGWAHLLADSATVHASNLHSMTILIGTALTGSHGPVEGWYVPGVDVLGFDCYHLDTELLAERYAAAKHKPVAFPEFGAGIGGSSDAISAAFARAFISALNSNTIAASWFNNYGNNLSSHPQTLAVLRSAAG